jgi:hypothetical protein
VNHVLRFLALGTAVAVSSPAAAQSINQFVGFSDSTIDSGWYRNNKPNGVPTAGGGPNFEDLFPDAVKQGAGRVTGLASFTGQMGQDKVTTYGGQVGLNVAF